MFLVEVDAMLKMRLIVACFFINLALCGCSSENSSSDDKKVNEGNKIEKPIIRSSNQPPGVSTQNLDNGEQHAPTLPTRSELKVLSDQAKSTENEVKDVIEQFDANLNNREARTEAEAKFKKVLPEYKKQMLQLGKAKLKEAD